MKQLNLFENVESCISKEDEKYSAKAKSPIYTPSSITPLIQECYNDKKFKMLCKEIEESNINDRSIEIFLKLAASRHICFNYEKIADFYASSDKKIQELMEKSALVIIDFDKAIEYGYVDLNKKMRELYEYESNK